MFFGCLICGCELHFYLFISNNVSNSNSDFCLMVFILVVRQDGVALTVNLMIV